MKLFNFIIIALILIGAGYLFSRGGPQDITNYSPSNYDSVPTENIIYEDGKQIINITARGGYQPKVSVAKSNMPTLLRFNTSGTLDCSLSVRIPKMKISKSLPSTGVTDIDLGVPKEGVLRGICGMGMYPFQIDFRS